MQATKLILQEFTDNGQHPIEKLWAIVDSTVGTYMVHHPVEANKPQLYRTTVVVLDPDGSAVFRDLLRALLEHICP